MYNIVKMQFESATRFGIRSLDNTFKICHSDTLFSAIFIEIMNFYGLERAIEFQNKISDGKILISTAFPYFYDEDEEQTRLFISKPIIYFDNGVENKKESNLDEGKSLKKLVKQIEYIQISDLENYINDIANGNSENIKIYYSKMIEQKMDVKVNMEKESNPYTVVSNVYGNVLENDGINIKGKSGLYFIIKSEQDDDINMIKTALISLQYTGIGGKRSIGYGRFRLIGPTALLDNNYDDECLFKYLENVKTANTKILISLLSPKKSEIEKIISDNSYYSLIRRGGFIYSDKYSKTNLKKKEIYMLAEGSCLNECLDGEVQNLAIGGNHNIYRNGKGMYIGINL